MKIALFGGSFDPSHLGHQFITQQLLERQIVDEVWFVPVKHHPFHKAMSTTVDRLAMLELLRAALPPEIAQKTKIETYEIDHPETSYSFETLKALSAKYPEHTFSWVIGSDNLGSFAQWYNFEELLQKFRVYVYPRQGFLPQPLQAGMIFLKDFPEITVSSTEIRKRAQSRGDIRTMVSPEVEAYILAHQLYQVSV